MSYDDCCYAIKDSGCYPYGTLARRETVDVLFAGSKGAMIRVGSLRCLREFLPTKEVS